MQELLGLIHKTKPRNILNILKNVSEAGHQWLTPVIQATQEAQRSGGLRFEASPDK
jgi:hypothetical protein